MVLPHRNGKFPFWECENPPKTIVVNPVTLPWKNRNICYMLESAPSTGPVGGQGDRSSPGIFIKERTNSNATDQI
jgi:hypothetical protein